MRRHLYAIAAATVAALMAAAPADAQIDPALQDSLDAKRGRVMEFLETDSTVQAVPAAHRQFLLIEDREGTLRIVAHAVSKVDLHQLGRATAGRMISGFVQPGVVAPSKIEYYVFRWNGAG